MVKFHRLMAGLCLKLPRLLSFQRHIFRCLTLLTKKIIYLYFSYKINQSTADLFPKKKKHFSRASVSFSDAMFKLCNRPINILLQFIVYIYFYSNKESKRTSNGINRGSSQKYNFLGSHKF